MRPRWTALLYAIPLCLAGLVVSACGSALAFQPEQFPGNHQTGYVALAIGLPLLVIPILTAFNNELVLADGEITKRGAFRRIGKWPSSEISRVHRYLRWMNSDSFDFSHYVYQFYRANGSIAFSLSQAWWEPKQIDELVQRLNVKLTSSDR